MKDTYIYPAIFEDDDGGYMVTFPDFPGCVTYGDTLDIALDMANEALRGHIACMEADDDDIPEPTDIKTLQLNDDQFHQLIKVFMPPARKNYADQTVRRNVTLPRWIDNLARREHLNVSSFLQEALAEKYRHG